MRLFRIGLSIVVVAVGCKREEEPAAGALRVDLSYATFRPGCLTVKAADKAEPSRAEVHEVALGPQADRARSRELTLAVFRKEGWSRDLVLTATAYERPCTDPASKVVDTQTTEAQVPERGVLPVKMDLRAEDLDDDGYVTDDQGGSDCNDDAPTVNPAIPEDCDGSDDNCSGDETDAPGAITYYADGDGDGYGDPNRRQGSCLQPPGTVPNSRDCDDTNPAIRPDQPEAACDNVDENCNGVRDDTFDAGTPCTTALGCTGALACATSTTSQCVSSQTPVPWYVDDDGDLQAGTMAGLGCQAPAPGAKNQRDDCDDSSPFVRDGGMERCDLLDNDCDGTTDESCGARTWEQLPDPGSLEWRAVAAYAENKAWVAGLGGALTSIEGMVAIPYDDCSEDWSSAWASPSTERVFLGSNDGKLAMRDRLSGVGCTFADTGRSAGINGLVGFDTGAGPVLFAVASDGRIYRWAPPADPVEVSRVSANLRDVHGTSPTNLLAVGAGSDNLPRAFRANPDGGVWIGEPLPSGLPAGTFLRGVHMVHGDLAYAAGDKGLLLERSNGTWSAPAFSRLILGDGGTPNLLDVAAYGRTLVYAIGNDKAVYRFNGNAWAPPDYTGDWTPFAINGVAPHDVWVAGSQGTVIHRGP
jgi:hypothetical protein